MRRQILRMQEERLVDCRQFAETAKYPLGAAQSANEKVNYKISRDDAVEVEKDLSK